jgi:hypothetical protein
MDKPIKKLILELELESGHNCSFKLENASYKDFIKLLFKLQGNVLALPPDLVDWASHPPEDEYKVQYPYYRDPLRYVEDK